jgi:tetratricopeptide (TPR) repeat protein
MKDTELGIPSESWKEIEQLLERGQASDALAILRASVAGSPDSFSQAIAYETLGAAYQCLNDYQAAIGAFEKAISLHATRNTPALTRIYVRLGLTHKADGNLNKALEVYEEGINKLFDRAIKIISEDEKKYMFETEDEGKRVLNVTPDALGRMKHLCRLDVTFAALRNNMGTCLAELGDIGTARQMFLESIEFTPGGLRYDHPLHNLESIREM